MSKREPANASVYRLRPQSQAELDNGVPVQDHHPLSRGCDGRRGCAIFMLRMWAALGQASPMADPQKWTSPGPLLSSSVRAGHLQTERMIGSQRGGDGRCDEGCLGKRLDSQLWALIGRRSAGPRMLSRSDRGTQLARPMIAARPPGLAER